jgi:hypothetical protein
MGNIAVMDLSSGLRRHQEDNEEALLASLNGAFLWFRNRDRALRLLINLPLSTHPTNRCFGKQLKGLGRNFC